MDEVAVLVLNHTFEPLHFTNARPAITLLLARKAESLESSPRAIRSPPGRFSAPGRDPPPRTHPQAVSRSRRVQQEEQSAARRLYVPVLQPSRRAAHGGSRSAALARGRHHLDERRRRLPTLQSEEGQPVARRERDAAHPRADPPEVRLLHAHAPTPPRAFAAGLVAQVSRRGSDAVLTGGRASFRLSSEYEPRGDQPRAIEDLTRFVAAGRRHSVLRGVTGSGKTYTMANLIANTGRPTLVLSPNKTLAAQLFSEFKAFFPDNAVEYFVSYYDYYQPEAYIPQSDTYIEKDALINDEIDRMRHSATRSLLERRDVVVVASVSCIYGIGAPETYKEM